MSLSTEAECNKAYLISFSVSTCDICKLHVFIVNLGMDLFAALNLLDMMTHVLHLPCNKTINMPGFNLNLIIDEPHL